MGLRVGILPDPMKEHQQLLRTQSKSPGFTFGPRLAIFYPSDKVKHLLGGGIGSNKMAHLLKVLPCKSDYLISVPKMCVKARCSETHLIPALLWKIGGEERRFAQNLAGKLPWSIYTSW